MEFHITKATYSDIEIVHEYMKNIFKLELNGLSLRPNGFTVEETKQYLPQQIDSSEKLCAVAVKSNRVVGQLAFSRYTKPEYRHGGKFGMSVHPDFWKKGIATSLLSYLESWAIPTGITKIELEVWANNESAIKLYEKNGYLHEGRRKGSIKTRNQIIDLVFMGKLIG